MSSAGTASRYPCGDVSIASAPNTLRSRTTQPWTTFGHVAGTSSAHRASAKRSALTTSPGRTASVSRTTRSRGPNDRAVAVHPQRSQDRDAHWAPLSRPGRCAVNWAVTSLLPPHDRCGTARRDNRP